MSQVNGKRQISTPYKSKTPRPIETKIGTIDYVGETYPHAKFCKNPFDGVFWAIGWNITSPVTFIYLLHFFFSSSPTGQTLGPNLTQNGSFDASWCKEVPFGKKFDKKVLLVPLLPPKPQNWPKNLEIFRLVLAFIQGAPKSKRPLFFIGAM